MSDFVKRGYLGREYLKDFKVVRNKYKDLFNLCKKLNKFCHKIYSIQIVHNNNPQEIIVSSLFNKVLTTFQGIIILAERGMIKDTNVLLRSMIESMFYLIEIQQKDNFYKKYVLKGEYEKIRLLKKAEKYENWHDDLGGLNNIKEIKYELEATFNKLLKKYDLKKEEINQLGPSKITNEAILKNSTESKLYQTYYVVYSWLCQDVHSNSTSIQDYFKINNLNKIEVINYGPTDQNIDRALNTAINCMIVILESVTDIFKIDEKKSLEKFIKLYTSMH